MVEVDADVWVLTETHLEHRPSVNHQWAEFSPEHLERRPAHERWTAIWSRWPLSPVVDPAAHRRGTVAAFVATPAGPVLVYGTVIAWSHEKAFDDGRPAHTWDVHRAEIKRQGAEWDQLRLANPDVPFIVAGDFNQSRDGSSWYGSKDTRACLDNALDGAGLVCVTEADMVATKMLRTHHLVDHVCVTSDLVAHASVSCLENIDHDSQRLSDHPVVVVDLASPTASRPTGGADSAWGVANNARGARLIRHTRPGRPRRELSPHPQL